MPIKKRTEKIANKLKIMSHPARLQILEELLEVKEGLNVMTLQKIVKVSQSAMSQHLSALKLAHILEPQRNGVAIFYHIKEDKTKDLLRAIFSY